MRSEEKSVKGGESKKAGELLMAVAASKSNLKASVLAKLLHLLRDFNYNPDSIRILSEYVVVLVSNGKCQSEVESALDAFLGDLTTRFVSWLWEEIALETSCDSSADSEENLTNNHRPSTLSREPNTKLTESGNGNGSLINSCSFKMKPPPPSAQTRDQKEGPPFKHSDEDINVGGKRLFSKAAGEIFLQKGKKRSVPETMITSGCVWDRLGKLTTETEEDDASVTVKLGKPNEGTDHGFKRQTLERSFPGLAQRALVPTVQENQDGRVKTRTIRRGDQKRRSNDLFCISGSSSDSLDYEDRRKFRRLQPENCTRLLNERSALRRSEKSNSYNKCSTSGFDGSKLVDMKIKLHQLETNIAKLQSKSVNLDGNHALCSSFGSVDQQKEGVESRTVCVTNVHVAATQDSLKSYFAGCGAITRVIKLTEKLTDEEKRSAYITFAKKESVDKALAFNGKTLFSRTISVRKVGKVAANEPGPDPNLASKETTDIMLTSM